jgi:hypothetical protein
MNIRICPTCGETQHLEDYGYKGALFIHTATGKMTCSLLPTKGYVDESASNNNSYEKGELHRFRD